MTKKIVFTLALALVVVGIAAPSASANCPAPKFASTYNSVSGAFINFTTALSGGTLSAQVWSGSTDFTGTCNLGTEGHPGSNGFTYFTDPTHVGFNYNLGDACVPGGCPGGTLTVRLLNTDPGGAQEHIAFGAVDGATSGPNFDYSTATADNTPLVPRGGHRPRVSASSAAAGTVDLIADPALGFTTTDQLQCVVRTATGTAAPGSLIVNWPVILQTLTATNGVCPAVSALNVSCTGVPPGQDRFIAVSYKTPNGEDPVVGPATRIKCNSAIAQPKGKIIQKKVVIQNQR